MTKKSKTTEPKVEKTKTLSLFDHVNHIRKTKSLSYFDQLSDGDKKTFNHYMILRFLSMDVNAIDVIASISKYFSVLPSRNFYFLCATVTPRSQSFFPYIKSKNFKLNSQLLELVARKFEVSTTQAQEYCKLLMLTEKGSEELSEICRGYGLTDKEVIKIMKYE